MKKSLKKAVSGVCWLYKCAKRYGKIACYPFKIGYYKIRYFWHRYGRIVRKWLALFLLVSNPYITAMSFVSAYQQRGNTLAYGGEYFLPIFFFAALVLLLRGDI